MAFNPTERLNYEKYITQGHKHLAQVIRVVEREGFSFWRFGPSWAESFELKNQSRVWHPILQRDWISKIILLRGIFFVELNLLSLKINLEYGIQSYREIEFRKLYYSGAFFLFFLVCTSLLQVGDLSYPALRELGSYLLWSQLCPFCTDCCWICSCCCQLLKGNFWREWASVRPPRLRGDIIEWASYTYVIIRQDANKVDNELRFIGLKVKQRARTGIHRYK
jgi:hypothetical protein